MDDTLTSTFGELPRKRTLRTYSKKRPNTSIERRERSVDKRRKTSPSPELLPLPPAHDLPRLPVPPPTSSFEKGSILNYFKPSRSSSSTDSSSDVKKLSSPPTSPIAIKTQRTARRLRLRPSTPLIAAFDSEGGEDDRQRSDDDHTTRPSYTVGIESDPVTSGSDLKEASATKVNEQPTATGLPRDQDAQPKKPTRAKSAPIQTTINLSTKPAFEECKLCRIVYNPLHPNDVKYHTKQHKAMVKSLARK